jgi:hypothetical protein
MVRVVDYVFELISVSMLALVSLDQPPPPFEAKLQRGY